MPKARCKARRRQWRRSRKLWALSDRRHQNRRKKFRNQIAVSYVRTVSTAEGGNHEQFV